MLESMLREDSLFTVHAHCHGGRGETIISVVWILIFTGCHELTNATLYAGPRICSSANTFLKSSNFVISMSLNEILNYLNSSIMLLCSCFLGTSSHLLVMSSDGAFGTRTVSSESLPSSMLCIIIIDCLPELLVLEL